MISIFFYYYCCCSWYIRVKSKTFFIYINPIYVNLFYSESFLHHHVFFTTKINLRKVFILSRTIFLVPEMKMILYLIKYNASVYYCLSSLLMLDVFIVLMSLHFYFILYKNFIIADSRQLKRFDTYSWIYENCLVYDNILISVTSMKIYSLKKFYSLTCQYREELNSMF